jgi:hypothetical protein
MSKRPVERWDHRGWVTRSRNGGPPLAFLSLLALSLLVRCASSDREPVLGSSQVVASGGALSSGTGGAGGSPIATGSGGLTIQIWTGTGGGEPDGGLPLTCTPATADRDCALPHSTCEGALSLAYYTDPVCIENTCHWTRRTSPCSRGCYDGGCTQPFTAVPAGPIDSGVECTPGDASTCELPPSVCLDQRTLLFFTNARCVAGACQVEALTRDCSDVGCANGGCSYHFAH